MEKINIVIPTINRADLLEESFNDLKESGVLAESNLLIIDNANQDLSFIKRNKNTETYRPDSNLGVAASWNYGINYLFGLNDSTEAVLVLNDDIVMGKTPEELKKIIKKAVKQNALVTGSNHWCALVMPRTVFDEIGDFDETFFPAYYEDNDYERRMRLAGLNILKDPDLDPKIFRNSQTIEKSPAINHRFNDNKAYFFKKWPNKKLPSVTEAFMYNGEIEILKARILETAPFVKE